VNILRELIKISNELDRRGLVKEADAMDKIAQVTINDDIDIITNDDLDEDERAEFGELGLLEDGQEPDDSVSELVADAIKRTMGMPHFENTFLTRNPGGESEGSTFNEAQTAESLMAATWTKYDHPEVTGKAMGYRTDIPGTFGIIKLSDLDPEQEARAEPQHKGEVPEGETLFVSVLVNEKNIPSELTSVGFTTILLGPGEDGDIVWTFFPGPPIQPSTTEPSAETETISTVADAIAAGFGYGKAAKFG